MISIKINRSLIAPSGKMNLDLNISINEGEFLCIYGESGAGKTSVLKMIAGLMKPDTGVIKVGEEEWFNSSTKVCLSPQKRDIGLVFQEYNLFPNLSVQGNLLYGSKSENKTELEYIIDVLQLGELLSKQTTLLSGGQRQRVALGRAVLQRPKILLLDEPLSALDYKMRNSLQDYIAQIHKDLTLTTILVSHDLSEIFKLCSRVLHINGGKLVTDSSPSGLFANKSKNKTFQLSGEILNIETHEILDILTILIGNQIVDVVHANSESESFQVGEKVLVSTMAFNPVIQKIR